MFEHQVQETYEQQGLDIARDPRFWETYRMSYLGNI